MKALAMQELLAKHLSKLGRQGSTDQIHHQISGNNADRENDIIYPDEDFNSKYCHDIKVLAPILLQKYADYKSRNPSLEEMKIDLRFMKEKLRNNTNHENVGRLIAFEKFTLEKASAAFHQEDSDQQVSQEFTKVNQHLDEADGKLKRVLEDVLKVKEHLKK